MSIKKQETQIGFTRQVCTKFVTKIEAAIVSATAMARPAMTLLVSACFTAMTLLGTVAQTVSTAALLIGGTLVVTPGFAQSVNNPTDINPPTIELEEIPSGVAGQEQVFTSLVSDEGDIKDVTLFYRYKGQQAFVSLPMNQLGNSVYYVASVRPSETETRAIEYYVQAIDIAGNRQIEGFAFEPITRELNPPDRPSTTATTPTTATDTTTTSKSGGLKIWHIVVGVLAVGLIAGAAAGGGGGSDSSPDETVPLTLTVNSP